MALKNGARQLHFIANIRQFNSKKTKERIDHVVDRLQLNKVLDKPIDTLSKGFKRRVGLAQAILHDPDLLILDEPTDGLDPNQKFEVRKLLADLSSDKAVIISTHILEEVEAICTRAILIANGKVVADETPEALEARSKHHKAVGLKVANASREKVIQLLNGLSDVSGVETTTDQDNTARILAFPREGADLLPAVREAIGREKIDAEEVFVERGRLDDVFRNLTRAA